MSDENSMNSRLALDRNLLSEVVVDIWRIQKRALRDGCETVQLGCERTLEHLHDLGFRIDEMLGRTYSPQMRVRVVHQEGEGEPFVISECLIPAVYYQNDEHTAPELIRVAEVITKGESTKDGASDC